MLDRNVPVAMEAVHMYSGDQRVRRAGNRHQRLLRDNCVHHLV